MLFMLDEAANYPLPSLPSLMSEADAGITTVAVFQSLAQARDGASRPGTRSGTRPSPRSSPAAAATSAAWRHLPAGREIPVTEWSRTLAAAEAGAASASIRYRPVIEPADIRQPPYGSGLLLLRTARPLAQQFVVEDTLSGDAASKISTTAMLGRPSALLPQRCINELRLILLRHPYGQAP